MFTKALASATRTMLKAKPMSMLPMTARGVYTADTQPYVFINEHTKVLCQGMTGKHVSNQLFQLATQMGVCERLEKQLQILTCTL